jgi:hypothetical protein
MNRMFVLAVSICLCFLQGGVTAQEEKNTATKEVKAATISGQFLL